MMLDKQTSKEIWEWVELSNFEINHNNITFSKLEKREDKVWVSQESLIKMFLEDKEFSNDIDMKNYIDDVINSLKGEKE